MSLCSWLINRRKPKPAPPEPTAMWRASAEALYREELHREIDEEGWRVFQEKARAGWQIEDFRVWIRASDEYAQVHAPKPEPPKITLPILRADGRVFRLPDGAIWRWQGATAFSLLRDYLNGDTREPYLDWVQSLHVNTLRVLCRCWWLALNPKTVPDYFAKLGAFLDAMESRGLRVEVVALADCRTSDSTHVVPPEYTVSDDEMRAFLLDVAAVVRAHPAHLLEDGNEHPFNGWDPKTLPASIPGVLRSRGCGGMDEPPVRPPAQFGTFHSGRGSEFARKMGKQAAEWSYGCGINPEGGPLGVPVVDDEPEKPSATCYPVDWYDGHASASLLCAGSTLHGEALKWCRVPEGREREALELAARAWRDVSLDAPLGQYTRGGLAESPVEHDDRTALRSFATISGNRATAVVIGKRYAGKPVGRNGWRVVGTAGPLDQVAYLER